MTARRRQGSSQPLRKSDDRKRELCIAPWREGRGTLRQMGDHEPNASAQVSGGLAFDDELWLNGLKSGCARLRLPRSIGA